MGFTAGYKVNEGTDYEFTVSNETISEVVLDTGISESDIADYCYSALIDSRIETVKAESHTDRNQADWHSWCVDNAMFYYIDNTRYINSNTGINNTSDTVYERNFLVWHGTIYPGEAEEKTGWFLIMDIKDIKKFYVDFSSAGFSQSSVASTRTDSGVTTPFTGYTGDAYLYQSNLAGVYPDIYQNDNTLTTIRVVNVLNINDELWVGRLNPSNYGEQTVGETKYGYSMYIDYYDRGWLSTTDPDHFFQKGSTNWSGIPKIYDMEYPDLGFDVSPTIETYAESDNLLIRVDAEHYGGFNVLSTAVVGTKTLDGILTWMSWCGLLFKYGGNTYKPIIENGVIVGYSSDMFTPSEFDTMTNVTGNNISPTPPSPVPSEDDEYADMGIGTGGNVGGLTSYAIMSINDLAELIADFNARLQAGQSVVNNFICCYKLGPLSSFLCTTGAHNIIMTAYSTTGNNFVSDRANYAVVSSQKSYVNLGSYTVPRKTGTFYDFAPYSTYELFIPCCGWVPLPDSVAGRTITVYLVFDLASCVCKGICRIGGTTIAEISGVIGSSVPFYVNDSGLARAALVTGVTQTIGNFAIGAVGAGTSNTGLAMMGLVNAVQSAQQTAIAGNTNYTAVRGGNGDMSAYANGEYCTIKITHPLVDKIVNTSMFGHSVGYLCETVGKLSNFHGFTVCANPHVHINATSSERDEITQLLEQGVILP